MYIQSVLIELDDGKILKSTSGTLINNDYIITPSNILIEKIKKSASDLSNIKTGLLHEPEKLLNNKVSFTIIDKCNETTNRREARLSAFFKSESIERSVGKYLLNWRTDGEVNYLKQYLSIFLVLTFEDQLIDVLDAQLSKLHLETSHVDWDVTDRICVRSTPFGNRQFIDSYSEGVVSNIVGEDRCFIWSDCPTVFGSEGSPMFCIKGKSNHQLFGIVLTSLNWINGEWLGLTLGTTFRSILCSFSLKSPARPLIRRQILDSIRNGIVIIKNGPTWGSAILLDKNKGIFLTNAHVVENSYEIEIYWNKTKLPATIVYQVPSNKTYDLALLRVDPKSIKGTQMISLKVFTGKLNIGDAVLAAGYPLYPPEVNANITVTSGNISRVSKTMLGTTCSILPGSSGGAVLTPDGYLIGIITSNTSLISNNAAFPRINMIIPFCAIWSVLQHFLDCGDTESLESLALPDESGDVWTSLKHKL